MLFNATHPSYKPHYLTQQVKALATEAKDPAPSRKRIRTTFGEREDQPVAPVGDDSPSAALSQYSAAGYFSAVQALSFVHNRMLGAWEPDGLPSFLAAQTPTANDPSPSDPGSAYQANRLFSYVPDATDVTPGEFADMNDPTKRVTDLANLALLIGEAGGLPLKNTAIPAIENNLPLIPFVQPHATGGALCNQRVFGVTIDVGKIPYNEGGVTALAPSNVKGWTSAPTGAG